MPGPLIGAAIQGATQSLGGVVNAIGTAGQNRKSRRWAELSYLQQKKDNLEFWNLQNEYNTPSAQMGRFRDAGLNPHLIYGQGDNGNAQAINTPDVQRPQFETPRFGDAISAAGTAFSDYYDLRLRAAQANNAEIQADILRKQGDLLDAQTYRTLVGGQDQEFDLGVKSDLRETSMDYQREKLRQLTTNIDNSIQDNARRAIALSTSVQEAGERMLTMQAERSMVPYRKGAILASTDESRVRLRNLIKDGTLKDIDIALRKKGINPGDPQWQRMAALYLDEAITKLPDSVGDLYSKGKKYLSEWWNR